LTASEDHRDRTAGRLFRLLGLHRGPEFSTWTAAALLGTSPEAAETALERLVDAQLLAAVGLHRYAMHDLLLLFAREQAARDEPEAQRRAALERMLDCYLATMQRAQQVLQPGDPGGAGWRVEAQTPPLRSWTAALVWFEQERANLLAAAAVRPSRSTTSARPTWRRAPGSGHHQSGTQQGPLRRAAGPALGEHHHRPSGRRLPRAG